MSKIDDLRARYRAVLTDTLPYEVPVIFSNDRLFANAIHDGAGASSEADKLVAKVFDIRAENSKPLSYAIFKDTKRLTRLGVVHPNMQLRMSAFYQAFQLAMLAGCQKSNFSLRRPVGETPLYSSEEMSGEKTFKHGIPHVDPADGEIDVSRVVSYFSYGKYNLLGKFYDSVEFRRLEKRFRFMKAIDVSRCFFNIYTHSIAWAVKGKPYSKDNRDAFSFEAEFDRLMQECNYGETNGIVVGPEISRIFAEIIMQNIDVQVEKSLPNLQNNKDYAVRRYVDDFIIFSNSVDDMDKIEREIAKNLEEFKLFLNDNKTESFVRPFVSPTSRLRGEIAVQIQCIYDDIEEAISSVDSKNIHNKARSIGRRLDDIRRSSATHSVPLHSVSGWILSNLRNVLSKSISHAGRCGKDCENALFHLISSLIDLIFHLCSLDLRVRTTYSLCQILEQIRHLKDLPHSDLVDRVMHLVSEEMSILIRSCLSLPHDLKGGVELCNLLIGGKHYLGDDFIRTESFQDAISYIIELSTVSYFQFVTVKFCLGMRSKFDVAGFDKKIFDKLMNDKSCLRKDAESFMLFCDFLSCPYIAESEKRKLFVFFFEGNPSKQGISEAGARLGFIDWTGLSIRHTLARKALRPVYSWA